MEKEKLIELAEEEVSVLETDLEDKNWEGIFDSLSYTPLNDYWDKMEKSLQTKFKDLIQKTKDALEEDEENINKETFMYLQELLEKFL